jgi:hypothetical protein
LGDILNIRVTAQTLNEEDVAKAWPALCTLAWPQWMDSLKLSAMRLARLPDSAPRISAAEQALGRKKHGVLELAQSLEDIHDMGETPARLLPVLQKPLARVKTVSGQLSKALSAWKTQEANLLSNQLEDALDEAEQAVSLRAEKPLTDI